MKQTIPPSTSYCGHCHRQLPVEAFYTDHNTNCPDRYCIACRKEISRIRYCESHSENKRYKYPVITNLTDGNLRIALILHAKQVVNESVARKRKLLHEVEYLHSL